MTISKQAFLKCGQLKADITDINVKWSKADKGNKIRALPADYRAQRLDEFCEHYNRELKALYDNGDHGTKYQAHDATELIDRLTEVELRQERALTDLDQLYRR